MDSIGSISNEDVLVFSELDDLSEIKLTKFPQGTYINFKKEVSNSNIIATDNSAIGGAGVNNTQVSLTKKNERINFQLRQTTFENSEIAVNDSTQAKMKAISSNIKDSTFSFNNENNSISFAGNSTIDSSRLNMKSGNDTIQFAGRCVIAGENNITLGSGRDTVSIGKQVKFANNTSSLIIKDFDKDDTLRMGNKKYNLNNISAGQIENVILDSDGSVYIGKDF